MSYLLMHDLLKNWRQQLQYAIKYFFLNKIRKYRESQNISYLMFGNYHASHMCPQDLVIATSGVLILQMQNETISPHLFLMMTISYRSISFQYFT